MECPIFGIDLGTTCSAIALVEAGTPRILSIDGRELVPSVVWYPSDGHPVVGRGALGRLPTDPHQTIRAFKRHMGTGHRWRLRGRQVTPAQVGAAILRHLVVGAQRLVGCRPRRVVITVPAWFNHAQRADTMAAGEQAGLQVVRLINEPTAAALAHAHGQDMHRRALVYDLGGGTFDVSLIQQEGLRVRVLSSHGDTRLGGDDFDEALARFVLERVAQEDSALARAIQDDKAASIRLRLAAEEAKVALSAEVEARLRVPFIVDIRGPRHLDVALRRRELEQRIHGALQGTLRSVERVLQDAGCGIDDVDDLLLVGGSTRIPRVWNMLREALGLEGDASIPVDRAVVLGAAIQAAILDGQPIEGILVDVAPYSLSVGVVRRTLESLSPHFVCRVITPRNAPLPALHSETFRTGHPSQQTVKIPVFQGSAVHPADNAMLGFIELRDLPPAPGGQPHRPISVQFRHNLDGMVSIRVSDDLSGRTVGGNVAADGYTSDALRQELQRDMARYGYLEGEGVEDPLPEGALQVPPGAPGQDEVGQGQDEAIWRSCFQQVLGQASALRLRQGPHAAPLLRLARQGIQALDAGDGRRAGQRYAALQDLLLTLGLEL